MRNKNGFTLPDVILLAVIVAIMTAGGMSYYVTLTQSQSQVRQAYTAVNLATAQVEDLLAMDYDSVVNGLQPVSMPGYTVTYAVSLPATVSATGMTYKAVSVTVIYFINSRQITVILTGFKPK